MFPVEVRVAAADDIWLSTAYGRDSAYVAIHQYVGLPYADVLPRSSSRSPPRSADGRTGARCTLATPPTCGAYPRFADFLRIRDSLDPSRRFANPYL